MGYDTRSQVNQVNLVHSSYHYLNILFYEKSSDSYMRC